MTSREEAARLAREWACGGRPDADVDMTLWEFDLGFVAWQTSAPRQPGDNAAAAAFGVPRVVIDKQTGGLTIWPPMAPEAIAERYRATRPAVPRFPDDVRQVLTAAGWSPGRDVSQQVDRWVRDMQAADPDARQKVPPFPAAMDALAEFGGLRLVPPRRAGAPASGFRVDVHPDAGPVAVDACARFTADIGVPVFPFARYGDGPSDLVVDAGGRVFLLHPTVQYLVAERVDAAITDLVRGPGLWVVDDRGQVVDTARGTHSSAGRHGRTQQRVDLHYRLVRADGSVTPTTQPRSWYFDLPVQRHHSDAWSELVQRIIYDANVAMRRQEPRDEGWYVLDSFDISPVDVARMLAWDGVATRESAAEHLPWMLPPGATQWEPASRLIVDDAGRYDGMEGEDFTELLVYRALDKARIDQDGARAFLDRLYPGHGDSCLADREQRFANLVAIRPTGAFRREPGSTPWACGPPSDADVWGRSGGRRLGWRRR